MSSVGKQSTQRYLVIYPLPNGDYDIGIRSHDMGNKSVNISLSDIVPGSGFGAAVPDVARHEVLPQDVIEFCVVPFLLNYPELQSHHGNVTAHKKAKYLQAYIAFIEQESGTTSQNNSAFFNNPGNPLMQEQLDMLANAVVTGARSIVAWILSMLTPSQLKQALTTDLIANDYVGRTFKGKLFELALYVGDIAINDSYKGAVEIISSYFGEDADSQKAREAQLKNVFPDGIKAHVREQKKEENIFDFSAIIDAINHASKSELLDIVEEPEKTRHLWSYKDDKDTQGNTLIKALNQFREQFANHALSEKIPSLQHLLRAFTRYNERFDRWAGDDHSKSRKHDLFVRQILGFIQRFLPAHETQAFFGGLNSTVENRVAVPEDFSFRFDTSHHFPIWGSCLGLGFDYMVERRLRRLAWDGLERSPAAWWKTYVEQKQQTLNVSIWRPMDYHCLIR